MNDTPLHLAKREMQLMFHSRIVWTCLLATGVILGLAGPFGTEAVMPIVPRLFYWVGSATGFFFLGSYVGTAASALFKNWGLGFWPATFAAGAMAGLAIFAALLLLNVALFDVSLSCLSCTLTLGANVVGISMIITVAFVQIRRHFEAAQIPVADTGTSLARTQASSQTPEPSLMRRLPFEKRGALISMSVSDHYVEVVTVKGQELLLMRLSDAMGEVGDTNGMQVHRSHWVALDQISAARRDGAKAVLSMSDGRDIPASRTYVAALKEAGVFPISAKERPHG
ncbi:LytTR family DNA-binding domain-containing protein [Cognatishimia sp. WU-CL00825]|uniref:LytTR family DNA-binding domain-containing protein n=1 Tax=Cognatishimia sp. WU-CL00825 TaxID=3127658 RepID=UPI0031038734